MANGSLLARLDGQFDVFVTADKNLRYQQNLSGRTIAIVEFAVESSPLLRRIAAQVAAAVASATPGASLRMSLDGRWTGANGPMP